MNLDSVAIRKYFESRLPDAKFRNPGQNMVRCCFHQDSTASLSINLEKGTFFCHGCQAKGGYLAFEEKFSSCDTNAAWANIAEITGMKEQRAPGQKPEAVYQYRDASGKIAFEKLRYPGKHFQIRRPDGKGGWIYKLDAMERKPLYNLPAVLVSNEILIAEGEKDADNAVVVLKALASSGMTVAGTTNFDGAGKWRDSDSVYLAGKRVVIFADNDDIGRKHAEAVAASVYKYALGVRVIQFADLPEKGDVSDFLKGHSPAELVEKIKKTPQWHPIESESSLLIPSLRFTQRQPEEIDWLVEGIIERGANGFFVAEPKAGKSFAAVDLSISLAIGGEWMGFRVPRPVKVAVISREDNPALTAWRIGHLLRGKERGNISLFADNHHINTREQSPQYRLDDSAQYLAMLADLKRLKPEVVFFDVFNRIHAADENDNQEMCGVLQRLSDIQAEVGCSIAVIHHFNKAQTGSLIHKMRGSSAISGWAEWVIGISMADVEMGIRKMEFEAKVEGHEPIYFRIIAEQGTGLARLARTDYTAAQQYSRGAIPGLRQQ